MSDIGLEMNDVTRVDSGNLLAESGESIDQKATLSQAKKDEESLTADEDDQVTTDVINPGGKVLQALQLSDFFRTKVKQPKKGETVAEIKLKIPYTRKFFYEQKKVRGPVRKTNEVRTAKYNAWTFLPLAAAYQFRRFTNMFYLIVAVIAIVGFYVTVDGLPLWTVSFNPGTIIALLAVVVGVALLFEGTDDWKRHSGDRCTNNQKICRIRKGALEETTWGDLLPGDLVFVNDRESVPADLLLLCSYGADKKGSTCYIETSGIDGETNLKIKEVPLYMQQSMMKEKSVKSSLASCRSTGKLSREMSSRQNLQTRKEQMAKFVPKCCAGTYRYEQPNVFLQFNGSFEPRDSDVRFPLEFKNLLLRGSTIRNTKWIIGAVMYAGPETKLSLSRKPVPAKFGRIDLFMNKILTGVALLYLCLIVIPDVLVNVVAPNTADFWYFQNTSSTIGAFATPAWLAYFFTYLVLLYNIIPVTIIIVVEVMNFYAQFVLASDIEMYHEQTDTPAACRTSNLVAEIGQITHIFSDKTGTLTRNEMKMIGCWVNGEMYGYVPPIVDTTTGEVTAPASTSSAISNSASVANASTISPSPNEPFNPIVDKIPSNDQNGDVSNVGEVDIEVGLAKSVEYTSEDNDDDNCSHSSMKSIQVEDVFSDVISLLQDKNSPNSERQKILDFVVFLAVCHTVVLDWDQDGNPSLNSESPDEEAFVKAAGIIGVELMSTADGVVTIKLPTGEEHKYRLLALNPFNSTRKRMSMVMHRVHDDTFILMMKGADNKMLERLAPGGDDIVEKMKAALIQYSWNGLRTLVMGSREIKKSDYLSWEKIYKEALVAPSAERGEALAKAAELIEKDVFLVGASAIEDQLQLGVPDAVKTLREAGIQVWVLTGDKVETAINIGLSSNLIDSKMLQLKLVSEHVETLESQLDEIISVLGLACTKETAMKGKEDKLDDMELEMVRENLKLEKERALEEAGEERRSRFDQFFGWWYKYVLKQGTSCEVQANVALVISGVSLELLLATQKGSPELEAKLLDVARACKVVLACRVSPAQKALIVSMVRHAPDVSRKKRTPVTLGIGDGANDVPMLQESHVGIGISGHEGQQAVNSSDFSIAQFRFLVRMLLVHGRWNYRRQANVIVYVTYSWLFYTFFLWIYLFYSLYSGSQVYYSTAYIAVFAYFANVVIVAHGWFDRDISADAALRNPWTYAIGVKSDDLNMKKLMTLTLRAVVHLLIVWGFIMMAADLAISGEALGSSLFLAVVMVLYTKQLLVGTTYTSITVALFVVDFAAFLIVMAVIPSPSIVFTSDWAINIWTGVILSMATVVMIEMVIRYVKKEFFPRPLDLLIEQDRGYYLGSKHSHHAHEDAFKVLEEFGKISVLPFTVGAQRIKKAIDESRPAASDSLDSGTEGGRTSDGEEEAGGSPRSAGAASVGKAVKKSSKRQSAFLKMAPAFDFDYSKIGSAARDSLDKVKKRLDVTRTGSQEGRETLEKEEAKKQMNMSVTRLDLFNYDDTVLQNPDLNVIAEDGEDEEDDEAKPKSP